MLGFDISRFRELAFGQPALPDHPLKDEAAVRKLIEELPASPLTGLAELTHWVLSINTEASFTPSRRARVLLALDAAARPYWSELAELYLAPDGTPAEGHDGDPAILRALLDSAFEFATGYGYSLQTHEKPVLWIEKNFAQLALQRARWLARRFTLANMLHLPVLDSIWADLHALYRLAGERDALRKVIRVDPEKPFTSSVKLVYTRVLLTDMADLDTLRGRDVELAFRIAGRVAANARLEADPIPGAICAIEPHGSSRPTAVRRLHEASGPVLYLDAYNCLPRLKAMLERGMGTDLSEPDTLLGFGYTLGERNAMINRLIDLWGPTPPQRRSKRVQFNAEALVKAGFDDAVEVIPALEQGDWKQADTASALQILHHDAGKTKAPERLKKSLAEARVKLIDASVRGLGLLVPRKDASWARLGMLIAVYVEPGPDWIVGAVRRIGAEGEQFRLGVAVITRQPRLVWFHLETTGYVSVWEEEKRLERNFFDHFQRAILIDAERVPLGSGEMLVAPGVAERGSCLDIPFARGMQRIRVATVRESTEAFDRVAFESLGVTLDGAHGK